MNGLLSNVMIDRFRETRKRSAAFQVWEFIWWTAKATR